MTRAPFAPDHVFLHSGHGKTGSSFIQSSLALSADMLARRGMLYPISPADRARAAAGRISAGNLMPGPGRSVHPRGAFRALVQSAASRLDPGGALIVSNENIFRSIAEAGFLDEVRAAFPQAHLHVLLFIRDPFEHAVSAYQQNVKRQARSDGFGDFLPGYRLPAAVLATIKAAKAAGVELSVLNYSRNKRDLIACVEGWLGLEPGALQRPPVARVNRSLTRAEMEFQRAFNRHFGKGSSRFISDVLCNELPDIVSEIPYAAPADLAGFLDRMHALVAPVNALLPEGEHYHVEPFAAVQRRMPSGEDAQSLLLTSRQIRLLARSLSAELKSARHRP